MLTTIAAAIASQFASIFSFITTNPLAKKITIGAIICVSLWYAGRLINNHAYEQGKADGSKATWAQAEKAQEHSWADAQAEINKLKSDLADQVKKTDEALAQFNQKHAAHVIVRQQEQKKVTTEVAQAEQKMTEAPKQDDGLPSKDVIIDVLNSYKAAYESTDRELQYTEAQYDESVKLMDESIAERGRQIDALTTELSLVKEQRDFYKQGFENATRKHGGFGHLLKKIFTLGIAR